MSPDAELMLIFGTLHLIAVALGALLFVMFLRSEATKPWQPPDEDEGGGGGGNDRLPHAPAHGAHRPAACRCPTPCPPRSGCARTSACATSRRGRQRRPAREPAPQRRPRRGA